MNSTEARVWFLEKYTAVPFPTRSSDGTIDYEAICGEFIEEGVPQVEVQAHYDALAASLKKPTVEIEVRKLYHELWTNSVGQKGYNKAKWKYLGNLLEHCGVRV